MVYSSTIRFVCVRIGTSLEPEGVIAGDHDDVTSVAYDDDGVPWTRTDVVDRAVVSTAEPASEFKSDHNNFTGCTDLVFNSCDERERVVK